MWHTNKGKTDAMPKVMQGALNRIQNRCLRTIAGAYKATPIPELEKKTNVVPIIMHLEQMQVAARQRLHESGCRRQVKAAAKKIQEKLRSQRGRRGAPGPTPGEKKYAWASTILGQTNFDFCGQKFPTPYSRMRESRRRAKKYYETKWKEVWASYCAAPHRRPPVIRSIEKYTGPKLHEGLDKAESALATQIRTEVIGLANFLYRTRAQA